MSITPQYVNEKECKWTTFVALLNHRANVSCEQTAYTFLHRGETELNRLTYGELEQQAKAIATFLQSLKASGERALLLYPPGIEFIAAFFGCLYAGVIAVPAYPPRRNQKMDRLQAIVKDAKATVVLTTASVLSKLKNRLELSPNLQALHWLATDDVDISLAQSWQKPKLNKENLAFLQYTSGSTGTPKGVMISHGNLIHNSDLIHKSFGHKPESKGVIWLPPYHDMGLIGGVLQPLYAGFPVILISPADFLQKPLRWLRAITRYKATTSGGPNFAYDLCVSKTTPEQRESLDLSSWEVAFNGAETIRAETLEKFTEAFKPCGFRPQAFYPCYGMAETTLIFTGGAKKDYPTVRELAGSSLEQNQIVAATGKEDNIRKIVSCGEVRGGQQLAIVDPETLTRRPADSVGEIWVAGKSVAQGYWHRPQETEEAFNAYIADSHEGPFLRTGDLGFVRDGELFVTGRIKDLIIIKGQNHYPQDIEFTVAESHPTLKAGGGAAFSVDIKGTEKLVIVQEVERSYLRKLNAEEVIQSIRQAVTAEHSLQPFATVLIKTGSIPKTSSGKVRRHACKQEFLAGNLNIVNDWSENPCGKAEFLHLRTEVESVLQKLQTIKH